jgi:hypothetical protein
MQPWTTRKDHLESLWSCDPGTATTSAPWRAVQRKLVEIKAILAGTLHAERARELIGAASAGRKTKDFLPRSRCRSVKRVFLFSMRKKFGHDFNIYKSEGWSGFLPRSPLSTHCGQRRAAAERGRC